MSLLNKITLFIIIGIRPLLGNAACRYSVTCTQYASHQLQEKPFIAATCAIVKRLFLCNPFF